MKRYALILMVALLAVAFAANNPYSWGAVKFSRIWLINPVSGDTCAYIDSTGFHGDGSGLTGIAGGDSNMYSDTSGVAKNAKLLEGKDTTALWNAKTLQGKDTTALFDRMGDSAAAHGGTGSFDSTKAQHILKTWYFDSGAVFAVKPGETVWTTTVTGDSMGFLVDTTGHHTRFVYLSNDSVQHRGNQTFQNLNVTGTFTGTVNARYLQGKDTTGTWPTAKRCDTANYALAGGGSYRAPVCTTCTTSGWWHKPVGLTYLEITAIGPGGAGGGGAGDVAGSIRTGGTGGGGGNRVNQIFAAASLNDSEYIHVGARATGGTAGDSSVGGVTPGGTGNGGTAGDTTKFSLSRARGVWAFSGGQGYGGHVGAGNSGAAGAGVFGPGANGADGNVKIAGGGPRLTADYADIAYAPTSSQSGGRGGQGTGEAAIYGGSGSQGNPIDDWSSYGTPGSVFGGSAGANGGSVSSTNNNLPGSKGGRYGDPGYAGWSRTAAHGINGDGHSTCGSGADANDGKPSGIGVAGGDGGDPGGGGAGGAGGTPTGGKGGKGGRGEVWLIEHF